jgi:hypothetical protein
MTVPGKDEVDAGLLELAVEKQLRVRNDDGARRNVGSRHRSDMELRMRMRAQVVRQLRVEFAGVIQMTPEKMSPQKRVNISIIFNGLAFHSISRRIAKPSVGRANPVQVHAAAPLCNMLSVEYSRKPSIIRF